MSHVLVIGGGLSGCTIASELASHGVKVTVAERACGVGGKVRGFGCKATDKCNNCGVCLVSGLWEKVEKNPYVDILTNSNLVDLTGNANDFSAVLKTPEGLKYISGISSVVVATGYEEVSAPGGHLQIEGKQGIIRGLELEAIFKGRNKSALFEKPPKSVAFIQCVGSRDKKEDSMYCSRVCCSYSTRAAKVIREYYPECGITFFYMELQAVSCGDYFSQLREKGIEFIKCRPLKITGGQPVIVEYEETESGRAATGEFSLVILSEGIHPPKDADITAELCRLGQDKNGFLKTMEAGVFVSGCAKMPGKIEETYSDSLAVAREILALERGLI